MLELVVLQSLQDHRPEPAPCPGLWMTVLVRRRRRLAAFYSTLSASRSRRMRNSFLCSPVFHALAIGDGVTVGRCHSLPYSRRVQVDNYFSASDIGTDSDKQAPDPSLMLYPGEADTATAVTKPIIRSTCLETHAASTPETATDEHLGDDTQPFSLDQSFDYDHVALTPKFSEAEMKFLDARGRREVGEKES
ncbi:intraflagellar transport-associated protein isoform X2 [Pseudophryne corroboree]|uniref:intraflagellar transport-associated protein isoform X2 n=1 Tax=Pseudophryne corroboree TaxID=495146 RepID=UPI003081D747